MDILGIVIAAAIVGGTGIIIAVLLGIAGTKFKVEVDEKEIAVRDLLPGNNCGGCGYPGCDGLAAAISSGQAKADGCPVGGSETAEKIAEVMGVKIEEKEKMVAYVKCAGDCNKAKHDYNYVGPENCKLAENTPGGGPKTCNFGCTGFGSCKAVCPFDAIDIIEGIAVINKEKCMACGKCIAECPKKLIELIPYSAKHMVRCNSKEKGKAVKNACDAGCIGCGMCAKNCQSEAITFGGNLAHIDPAKCTNCGVCKEKCPVKVIS